MPGVLKNGRFSAFPGQNKALEKTELALIPSPAVTENEKNEYADYVATECYINFAWIGSTILFPRFGLKEDSEALA